MARDIKLNLALGVDGSEFKKAIDKALNGEIRRTKVQVDAELNGAGDSFGRSAVAHLNKATVKADFSNFAAEQIATRIASTTGKAVEDAVRKASKGDLLGSITGLIGKAVSIPVQAVTGTAKAAFGAIANGATATARTAFQGIIFGATQSASAELGQGISAGLQKAIGGTIGSPELIGRKIVEKLSKAISDAALEEGVNLPGIGKEVKQALGEREVLTDSRAKSAQDRQVKKQREQSAQVELNRERQDAARIQSEAIESYARIAQSVEKQSQELVEKNREAVKDLRARLNELASQGDSADKSLKADLEKQLNQLLAPLVELENIQKQARAKLNEQFINTIQSRENLAVVEGGDSYREVLQKRADALNKQQLELVDRIQALQQTLGKGLKAEQSLAGKLEAAPDDEKPELLALQEEAKASIEAIAAQINGLKKARTEISDEIQGLAQQAKAIPKGPNKVVVDILKELGFGDIDPENIPQVQLATDATLSKASNADYVPEANLVRVRQELFDRLQAAQSTNDLTDGANRRTIREEIAHSAQFDFGSAEGNKAFVDRRAINRVSDPTAEDIQRLGPELQRYVQSGRGKDAQVELEAKVAADRLAEKTQSLEKQAKDLNELEKTFGYAGTTVSKLLTKTVEGDRPKVNALKSQAQELGEEAIAQVQALEALLNQLELSTRQVLRQVAEAKTGNAPQIDVANQKAILEDKVKQLFGFAEQVTATDLRLKEIAQRPPEPVRQSAPLTVATEQVSELSGIVSQVGSVLAPIGTVADGTVHALAVVGKAGLALADKFGFAAASFIPGGALAYGPAKEAVKFAGPAVAAGAIATQIPAAGEIIGAISNTIAAIIAPATSGLSASVGHAVSAEIVGALPTLFSQLSRLVAESGLPGSEITAAAVDKLGGGLVHLLQPVISGVASTADGAIVGIGNAVNEFLGQVGGLLVAGKGLQEGVKIATNPEARDAALDAVQTVGAGVGQTISGIADGVENVKDALDRTKRAVERNVEEIKAGTQELAQGNIRAIADIKDSAEAAVSNIARGAQDVTKAVSTAGQEVRQGVGRIVDARPKVDLAEPDPWILSPETIEVKAQAVELDIPKITHEVPAQYIEVEVEEVDLVVDAPRTKLDEFREQLTRLDDARDEKIDNIRQTYQELKKDVAKSKTVAKRGDVAKLRELQEAIAAKRTKILKEVDDLSQESEDILQALNTLGIETGANTAIRDKVAALRQSLTKTKKGTLQQVAQTGTIPGIEPPDSLQALNLDSIQESIELGAKSLSGALKSLVETIFEVRGETLAESLAFAVQSPRGKDLAVNAAGLAASVAASPQGPVAGIAADLVGALAARQAVGGGGAETFGDITGFITGNAANALTGVPGSGALAASVVVPQLQKLRDRIQEKYGQPLNIDVPVDLQFDSLQELNPNINNANKQIDQIDALLAELRKLEAEGKLITPTVGDRIREFLDSIANAFSRNDSTEIAAAIAKIETELARGGEAIDARLQEEIKQVEKNSADLQKNANEALVRLEKTLNEFDRIEEQINDRADRSVGGSPPNSSSPDEPKNKDDLDQFLTQKVTVIPTDEERGVVARKRLERDASERQINDTLRRGRATGSLEENQANADLAIASFEKNASKFDAVAAQIEDGSTKAQQNLRKAGETFSTFKQKIEENGGIFGVLGKVGQSLTNVAEKAGLPVGAIAKVGGVIKGVGIAALAYVGITQLGDALVQLGRQAFEVSTRIETLQTQLKFVGGESNLPDNLAFIRKESERLKRPLDQVTEGLAQLSIATKDTSLEGRTQEIASVIGTLGRVYGLSAENTKSIQYQLGQTIRLGRAQGDELRSISDAGVNVQGALEKVLGKSGADVRKQLEAGQISAVAVVNALKLIADTAKAGLPEALNTSAAAVDNLQRKFTDVSISVGEKLKPVVVGGLDAVGQALDLLVAGGQKVAPIFDAVGQALGLVLDVATPLVGAIAAIGGAIANDLIEGAAIPFQIIGAGLTEIRNGLAALENAATQALGAISSSLPSGLGEILKYANPVTIAIRTLGILIGVNLVASIIQSSVAIVGTMIPALVGLAGTMYATVIPAIGAAITASLAFIATPLGATIAAIGLVAAAAAPHLDELAIAVAGLSQEQAAANNRAIDFNTQYTKGLDQLQKGVPLTAEKLKELKDGFAQNVKEGKETAGTAKTLSDNLDRLQANAEAAAKIQGELAEAMEKSTEAIKAQSKAIDSEYNSRVAGLNEALANQAITQERFDAAELAAQEEKTAKYAELYNTQADSLNAALAKAQAQLLQPIPDATRTEVLKQITELEAQINDIETKSSEQRVNLAKDRIKKQEKLEQDRVKAAEIRQKIIENQVSSGTRAEEDGIIKIAAIQRAELARKIQRVNAQLALETDAAGELTEIGKKLYLERVELETELTKANAEEVNKRIDLQKKYLEIAQSRISDTIAESEQSSLKQTQDLLNQNVITQVEADRLRANSTRDRLTKELAAELANQQALESLPKSGNPEKQEEQERAIRASKLKTGQLATQLSEQQQRDQEALTKVIQEQIAKQQEGIQNLAERQNQAYTKQIELLGRLNTALEFQNKLIDARKGLQGAIGDYLQTEYKILIETAKTDEEKQRLTQKAAETELRFLGQRQALDRESLEVKLKIQKAEDARALAQNQVDQITSAAAVKSAQADLAKAKADPKTTAEELEALQLGIEAANAKLGAEQFKGQSLGAQTVFNQQQESTQRRTLALQQSGELDQKRFEYGKTLSPEQQEGFLNKLRNEIYQRLSKDKAIAPTDPNQNGPYTPTVYTGTFDAKTGVYTPSPESSTARTSRAVNVASAELPQLKDLLQGTVNFSNILKEQVDFRPANKALEQLVTLSREGNGILLMVANDPKQEITSTTYNQTLERRDRSNRGLPR